MLFSLKFDLLTQTSEMVPCISSWIISGTNLMWFLTFSDTKIIRVLSLVTRRLIILPSIDDHNLHLLFH